ncbi:MAG: carotenoid biosynthesis protein [Verrucomicrobia bacterium]|nr:carotenoid biosynthesis protein [Verrucomicrobiota bacterium]
MPLFIRNYNAGVSVPLNKSLPPISSADPKVEALLPSPWAKTLHRPLFGCFLAACAAVLVFVAGGFSFPYRMEWAPGVFLLLATATTLTALARRLPLQNVLWAAALIGTLGSLMEIVGVATGFPFGAYQFQDSFGRKIFDVLPWPVPLAWVALVLNCRGVARLIVRPWRKSAHYGTWVIALAGIVGVALEFSLQPFATQIGDYWRWEIHTQSLNWHSAPWSNFLGRFCVIEAVLFVSTPWLLSKVPVKYPTDYHPLIVCGSLNLLFLAGNARHHLTSAIVAGVVAMMLVGGAALIGALWKTDPAAATNQRRGRV